MYNLHIGLLSFSNQSESPNFKLDQHNGTYRKIQITDLSQFQISNWHLQFSFSIQMSLKTGICYRITIYSISLTREVFF